MWSDNETELDFLNFTGVADTIAEIIVQAQSNPISIGVSGRWGVGKSSMIRLIRRSLERRENSNFLFVEFNAWLYQGYDDARAALMEVIASSLAKEAEKRQTGVEKAKEFLDRIDWFRVAKLVTGSAVSLAVGLPPIGLLGQIWGLGRQLMAGDVNDKTADRIEKTTTDLAQAGPGLLRSSAKKSPPEEIQALRDAFEETLGAMSVTVVVLIDDLDRCLPETTISTLEAIRLFLFLRNTAFVIAADDEMIKQAVRHHFGNVGDDLVTNYFDKLIQIPIRVPQLSTQEVRAYMMLLFVEQSDLSQAVKEEIRVKVCEQLGKTWQGKRVDRTFLQSVHGVFSGQLTGQLETADRLAPLMATATGIAGNPRLIKRFLNTLAIRLAISKAHGVGVDEAILAKMLLFERLGNQKAYSELIKAVAENSQGKPVFLVEWETKANTGQELKLSPPWDDPFIIEWLTLYPRLGDCDLRGVLHVSREHAPLLTSTDRLSSEAADLLNALLAEPEMAAGLSVRLGSVPRAEIGIIMDRLLDIARQEQEWGVPPILEACIVVAHADSSQGPRLAAFLSERPATQIMPNVVPKIGDEAWAGPVLAKWEGSSGLSKRVKKAIEMRRKDGNITVK